MLSEITPSLKDNTVWFHLYELPKIVRFIKAESTIVTRDGREGDVGSSMGVKLQLCKMFKV